MVQVFNVLTSPSGRPMQNQVVTVRLVTAGNPFTELDSEVAQVTTVDTDTDGRWDVDLIPTSQYEDDTTYYEVIERRGQPGWAFRVPDAAGPHWLRDLLVIPPTPGTPFPPVPPHALGDHTDVDTTGAAPGMVLKFNGTEWRPGTDNTGGGGSGGTFFEMFKDIAGNEALVPHGLGYRPAGIRLFAPDWQTEFDDFAVEHLDENNLTVSTGLLFRGWITVS